uniref:F-box domain-containing protein n=1 Tax=Caenorhabditis tropicalis TaxID=1561998 RepID=A0A1I7UT63_9PELO
MSFPLLRLPEVALEEVLKRFNPKEILFLVQTSLQARRRISRHRKSYSVQIRIDDGDFGSFVEISSDREKIFKIQLKPKRKGSETSWRFKRVVPIRYEGDTLVSRWKRIDTAIKEILDFLMEIFRIKEISFRFKGSIDTRSAVLIAEHCISKNLRIGSADWGDWISGKMAKRFLEASKSASNMIIGINSLSTICFYDFHLFRMDRLKFKYARWMTVEQIVALRNCKQVELTYVRLDESSINKILLEWVKNSGELQQVQMYNYRDINTEEAIKGLNVVRNDESDNWNGIKFSMTERWIQFFWIRKGNLIS